MNVPGPYCTRPSNMITLCWWLLGHKEFQSNEHDGTARRRSTDMFRWTRTGLWRGLDNCPKRASRGTSQKIRSRRTIGESVKLIEFLLKGQTDLRLVLSYRTGHGQFGTHLARMGLPVVGFSDRWSRLKNTCSFTASLWAWILHEEANAGTH